MNTLANLPAGPHPFVGQVDGAVASRNQGTKAMAINPTQDTFFIEIISNLQTEFPIVAKVCLCQILGIAPNQHLNRTDHLYIVISICTRQTFNLDLSVLKLSVRNS